jgi:uncharacterized protein YqeY
MSIKQDIHDKLIQALKDKDKTMKALWSTLLSEFQNAEKEGKHPHEFNEAESIQFINEQVKQRIKASDAYRRGGADERAEAEIEESIIIGGLLPQSERIREKLREEALALKDKVSDKKSFGMMMKRIKTGDDFTELSRVVIHDGALVIVED